MLDISPFLPCEEKKIESFRGSFVSVTSNDDIQYNGVLHQINLQEAILCIKNVTRCAKDEIQRDDLQILPQTNTNYRSQLPLSNEFYDHMVFHASDIKDLNIISQAKQSESIIGHFVSVITTENVRVEGTLTHLNLHGEVLIMNNAYCYGSEGRRRRRRIRSCNQLSDPVNFRFRDIMDMELIFLPSHMLMSELETDFPSLSRAHIH